MAEMHFEETCPCGNTIKVSGYASQVTPQIVTWHKTHDRHSTNIAKAIAEARAKQPTSYSWPWTTTTLTTEQLPSTFTYNTPISPDKT
jgi:hypothetical protein